MPTNLYGPNDNYHANESHVIAGLIRKFHEAKIHNNPNVIVWGTGKAKREFLHVDDFVVACHIIMNLDYTIFYKKNKLVNNHINVGSGEEVTIKELAILIKNITNFSGKIKFDSNKLVGQDKKFLNSKNIYSLGWKPKISLKNGLTKVYENFKNQYENSIKNI
jgi:GDP-L-fucose synthase